MCQFYHLKPVKSLYIHNKKKKKTMPVRMLRHVHANVDALVREALRYIPEERCFILSQDHHQFICLFSEALGVESANPVAVPIFQKSQDCSSVRRALSNLKCILLNILSFQSKSFVF